MSTTIPETPAVFAGRSLTLAVMRLAWPIILENLFQSAISLVDLWLVAKLGPVAVAGVGAATQIMFLLIGTNSAISIGATVMVAQAIGRGDREAANRVTRQAVLLSVLLSLIIGVLIAPFGPLMIAMLGPEQDVVAIGGAYLQVTLHAFGVIALMFIFGACLRGTGDSRTPMMVTGGINIINGIAAYLLIFGVGEWPGLGAVGSAWAAVLARGIGVIIMLTLLLGGRRPISIAGRSGWRPDLPLMRGLVRLGWPAALEQLIISGGFLVYSVIVIQLGLIAFATQRITFNLLSLSFMPGMGYSIAATTLVGQALGGRRPDLARRAANNAAIQATVLMTLGALLFWSGGEALMRFFSDDPALVGLGAISLQVLALGQPFWGLSQVMSGSLRGGGDTRYPMWMTMAGMWLLRLPIGYAVGILAGFGLPGVYSSSFVDAAFRSFMNIRRFRQAPWLHALPEPTLAHAPARERPEVEGAGARD
jgi:putative MATE family efflux protein